MNPEHTQLYAIIMVVSACAIGVCAEVAVGEEKMVLIRQSENSEHVLSFSPDEWRAFVDGVKAGEFDIKV